jgi:probable phosphoglycerate mutase
MFQGHLDIGLNERGRDQAVRTGRFFASVGLSAAYASDLDRAAATAELIVDGRLPITLDPDLRETHYGVLQGVRYAEAGSVLKAHGLDGAWERGELQRMGIALPGGESVRQVRGRSRRFVARIDALHPPSQSHNVLIVAHGGKLGVLLSILLGLPPIARHAFRFANCGITRVTRTATRSTLELHNLVVWNDACADAGGGSIQAQLDAGEAHRLRG